MLLHAVFPSSPSMLLAMCTQPRPRSKVRPIPAPSGAPPAPRPALQLTTLCTAASVSPFTEPTSPNPALTLHAETTEGLHEFGAYLVQCLPKFIQQFSVLKDELTVYVAPSAIIQVLTFLRDHSQCQFKSVMDLTAVDFPERDKRFEVVYNMLSVQHSARIRVKTYASETDAVPSAVPLFSGADWYVHPGVPTKP